MMKEHNFETIKNMDRPEIDNYESVGHFKIEDIVSIKICRNKKDKKFIDKHVISSVNGYEVKVSSKRFRNMIRNIDNFNDGIVPLYFSLENFKRTKAIRNHFNLYGKKDGIMQMITQDDILK